MDLNKKFNQNLEFNPNLFIENLSKLNLVDDDHVISMESLSKNHLYPKFPNSEQFTTNGTSPPHSFLSSALSRFHDDHLHDTFEASLSKTNHLKDFLSTLKNTSSRPFDHQSSTTSNDDRFMMMHELSQNLIGSLSFSSSNTTMEHKPSVHQPALNLQELELEGLSLIKSTTLIRNGVKKKSSRSRKRKNHTFQAKGKSMQGQRSELAEVIKGQWADDEDRKLKHLVKQHGARTWSRIAELLPGRVGKQCRERWQNHLRPNIKVELQLWESPANSVLNQRGEDKSHDVHSRSQDEKLMDRPMTVNH